MSNYNLVIIENKVISPYLNLTQQKFYDILWDWTYEDDLWDCLTENSFDNEELIEVILQFINDNVLHKYEDDDIDCFAFVNGQNEIEEYQIEEDLIDFVKEKIREHYD